MTPVGHDHLRVRAVAPDGQGVEAIAFRAVGSKLGDALSRLKGAPAHLAGTLAVNRYGGRERAQLRVIDVAEAAVRVRRDEKNGSRGPAPRRLRAEARQTRRQSFIHANFWQGRLIAVLSDSSALSLSENLWPEY